MDVFVDFSCDWSFEFYFPPLNIIAMVLRLAWTAEVTRHVINLTVSEVIALDYLCVLQSSTEFCLRALTGILEALV